MSSTDKRCFQSQPKIPTIRSKYVHLPRITKQEAKNTTVAKLEEDDDPCCLLGVLVPG
jgi:hypothetical protein